MARKRLRARVHGRVQGVAFREYARREAVRLELTGWVRNMPDGTVETVFEGPEDRAESFLAWLHMGSPYARVERVEAVPEAPRRDGGTFTIHFFLD